MFVLKKIIGGAFLALGLIAAPLAQAGTDQQDLIDAVQRVLPGIHDDAFLACPGRDHITVRRERPRGEPGDKHGRPL